MSKYRSNLPQLSGRLCLTDGGLKTTMVFGKGVELPCFAAFTMLRSEAGRATLREYYETYARLAVAQGLAYQLSTATWRASADWAAELSIPLDELDRLNREAVRLCETVRAEHETEASPMPIAGELGPRGDGYTPTRRMNVEQARDYHAAQISVFADSAADLISVLTLNYVEEAIGIAKAATAAGMPCVVGFTVETDGRLPDGARLSEAIERTDAETDGAPAYYMINCAHPTHFDHVLDDGAWLKRVKGLRANASCLSHAELDAATELDAGDPIELGTQYRQLRDRLSELRVVGGCCGTDHRHVAEIAKAMAA